MDDVDHAGLDVEEFLNGFDHYDGEEEVEEKFQSSIFLQGGCLSALENICIAELLACLSQFEGNPPILSRSNSSINNDLNAWISHW